MSKFKLIPVLGRLARLEELLEKCDLEENEKVWIKALISKFKKEKDKLEGEM